VEWAKYIPAFCELPLDDQVRKAKRHSQSTAAKTRPSVAVMNANVSDISAVVNFATNVKTLASFVLLAGEKMRCQQQRNAVHEKSSSVGA
jgi:hypothetical protein